MRVGLVSPERKLWEGEATELLARTLSGDIGVLPGHIPVLGVLAEGGVVTVYPVDGETFRVAVAGGFLSVSADGVSILAESAEFGRDIDVDAARAALAAAELGSAQASRAQGRIDAAAGA